MNLSGLIFFAVRSTEGIQTCYDSAKKPPSTCCGCVDWWTKGLPVLKDKTDPCNNINTEWEELVVPMVKWLKEGCPTCYVYVPSSKHDWLS